METEASLEAPAAQAPPETLPAEFQDQVVQIVSELGSAGYIRILLDLPGRLDPLRLTAALGRLLHQEPVLGCRFERNGSGALWRRREDLERVAECPLIAGADPEEATERLLAERFDPWSSPNLRAALIRGGGGHEQEQQDRLLLRVSHVAADGTAALDVAESLARLYTRLGQDPEHRPAPNGATRDSFLWLRSFSARDRWRLLLDDLKAMGRNRGSPRGLLSSPARFLADGAQVAPGYRSLVIRGERLAALDAYVRDQGVTLNDLCIAAFLRAFDRFCPSPAGARLEVAMPTNLRRYAPLQRPPAIRNLAGITHVRIGPEVGASLPETLGKVREATLSHKRRLLGTEGQILTALLARASFSRKRNLLRGQIIKAAGRPAAPILTNIGSVRPERLTFDTLSPRGLRIYGEAAPLPVFLTTVVRFGETLAVTVSHDRNGLDDRRVEAFLQHLEASLP